jgi:hypothetical protein
MTEVLNCPRNLAQRLARVTAFDRLFLLVRDSRNSRITTMGVKLIAKPLPFATNLLKGVTTQFARWSRQVE